MRRVWPFAACIGLVVIAVQCWLWRPRRRVPTALDHQRAAAICEYAAARMRCGERVLIGHGSMCYSRGGVSVPLDRVNSLFELNLAGYGERAGMHERLDREHYDLLILSIGDLQGLGAATWQRLDPRYKAFDMMQGALKNDFWFDGWQGYASWTTGFFERRSRAGRHSLSTGGRCDTSDYALPGNFLP